MYYSNYPNSYEHNTTIDLYYILWLHNLLCRTSRDVQEVLLNPLALTITNRAITQSAKVKGGSLEALDILTHTSDSLTTANN